MVLSPCRCLQLGLFVFLLDALLYPTCTVLDRIDRTTAYVAFTVAACLRCISASFAFTSSMVLLNITAPKDQIGAVNGAGQAVAAFVRGLAPAFGGMLWSLSVSSSNPQSQYVVFIVAVVFCFAAFVLYKVVTRTSLMVETSS